GSIIAVLSAEICDATAGYGAPLVGDRWCSHRGQRSGPQRVDDAFAVCAREAVRAAMVGGVRRGHASRRRTTGASPACTERNRDSSESVAVWNPTTPCPGTS